MSTIFRSLPYGSHILSMLTHLGIRAEYTDGFLKIDRTSMLQNVQAGKVGGREQDNYDVVLDLINGEVNERTVGAFMSNCRYTWGMKDDTWLWVELLGPQEQLKKLQEAAC